MKLKALTIGNNNFRKLHDLHLEIGDRLTIIGGLNGIGKSTILGLIANCSGIRSSKYKSYFELQFQAQFQELFHLDEEYDYSDSKDEKGYIDFTYIINNDEFIKRCSVSKHTEKEKVYEDSDDSNDNGGEQKYTIYEYDRLKIVPRTVTRELGVKYNIGDAQKIPIPTIYLGMSRMIPMGEVSKENIKSTRLKKIDEEDKIYLHKLFSRVVRYDINDTDDTILDLDIKYSKKRFKLPSLKHNSLAISLGQDSLSSIFTALASFNRLKRINPDYKTGLLLIDEIDAGLHHVAQEKLIELLKTEARTLNLQIICTTHSLTIFKKILNIPPQQIQSGNIPDKVLYLYDTHSPKVFDNPTYLMIKNNQLSQNLTPNQQTRTIKFYFEDDEALWFYEQVTKSLGINNFNSAYSVNIKTISLKLSCSILLDLTNADDFFKKVIIIVDNDVLSEEKNRRIIDQNPNVLALPSSDTFNENTESRLRSPERIIYEYLYDKVQNYDKSFWNRLSNINNGTINYDYIDTILDIDFTKNYSKVKLREVMKSWFNQHKVLFEEIGLFDSWIDDNPHSCLQFKNSLDHAISHVSNLLWPNI